MILGCDYYCETDKFLDEFYAESDDDASSESDDDASSESDSDASKAGNFLVKKTKNWIKDQSLGLPMVAMTLEKKSLPNGFRLSILIMSLV